LQQTAPLRAIRLVGAQLCDVALSMPPRRERAALVQAANPGQFAALMAEEAAEKAAQRQFDLRLERLELRGLHQLVAALLAARAPMVAAGGGDAAAAGLSPAAATPRAPFVPPPFAMLLELDLSQNFLGVQGARSLISFLRGRVPQGGVHLPGDDDAGGDGGQAATAARGGKGGAPLAPVLDVLRLANCSLAGSCGLQFEAFVELVEAAMATTVLGDALLDLSGNLHASADQNFPCVAKIIYQLKWNCTHGVLRELQLRKTDISPEQAESLAEIGAGDGIVVQL